MRHGVIVVLAAFLLLAGAATAGTINPGETREVSGKLTSVTPSSRCLVVEVPSPKGSLTVGVAVPPGAKLTRKGKPAALESLPLGVNARLRYTREGDRLLALSLEIE